MSLHNLALMNIATGGAGPITLAGPATVLGVPYLTFAQAGVVDGETVHYSINCINGSEVGSGVWTAATKTLTRTVVNSTNGGSPINVSADALVSISPLASDINSADAITIGTTLVTGGTTKGLLYDNAGVLGNLATANSGVLVTDGTGIPSISSTLPNGVIATTQALNDNTTKLATDAFVQAQLAAGTGTLIVGTTPISPSSTDVLFNNSGVLGGSSVLTFTPATGLNISPAAASNNPALTLTLSTPNSGTVTGPISLNSITVTDNAQSVSGGFPVDQWGQITNQTDVFRLNYKVTGGIANHFGLNVAAQITGTNGGVVPLLSSCYVNVGPITGDCWANIAVGNVGPSGNLQQNLIGYEAEMLVANTGVLLGRVGFSALSQGPTQGTNFDAAYMVSVNHLGVTNYLTAAPFKNGLWFSKDLYGANTFPIDTAGNVILADTGTVANFVSAPTLTVTGNIFDLPNFKVTGTGGAFLGGGSNVAPPTGLKIISPLAGAISVFANSTNYTSNFPGFSVDTSVASSVTGVYIFSNIAGQGASILTTSSATNEALKINAKGSGTIDLGGTSTGGVTIHGSFTATGLVTSADLNADVFSTAHSWGGIQTLTTPVFTGLPTGTGVATANTASTLVARDGSGNFSAGTITAALTGNATTATTATNATNGATVATSTNASFFPLFAASSSNSNQPFNLDTTFTYNPSTDTLTAATFVGALTGHASLDLALTGGTMSGAIAMGTNAITGLTTLAAAGALTFQSNGSTAAGIINTSQQWGIVNTSPKTTFDVNANTSSSPALIVSTSVARFQAADSVAGGVEFVSYGATSSGNIISGGAALGTAASPSASGVSQYAYNMRGYGYNAGWQVGGIWIMRTSEAWSAGHQGMAHDWYTTPNASTTLQLSMTLQASGGLSVGTSSDPGSGLIYTNSASFLMRTKTSLTGGGTGSVPTLTAGPAAGNPTKWLPYDDNGTTRYIPAW